MKSFISISVLLCLLVAGCLPPGTPVEPPQQPGSRLHLYLQPLQQETHRLTLTLSSISALRSDGSESALLSQPFVLDSRQLMGVQKKLLAKRLQPGTYQGLRVTVGSATLLGEDGETDLLVPGEPLFVEEEFTIDDQQSLALFLALSPHRLIEEGYRLRPLFSLYRPQPPLNSLKGFVSSGTAGTLSIFEKTTPAVVSVIALGHAPRDLVLDPMRLRLYVVMAGDDSVAAIDIANEAVQAEISLRPGDEPREVALSPDGRTLVTANPGSRSISVVDALSFYERDRILLSSEPSSVIFGRSGNRVWVLQSSSSTLALVDVARRRQLTSVKLEEAPVRGALSADGSTLFLITDQSPDLLVVDAATLAVRDRRFVGHGALCLTVNRFNGLVYIGKQSGEVAILDPDVGLPIDSLQLPAAVTYLTIDRDENVFFAVLPELNRVEKFDLVSKKPLGGIDIDAGGYAIAVMGEE